MTILLLSLLIGLYIMLEAIQAVAAMDGGDRACRVVRYVLAALVGLQLIWYGFLQQIDWVHIALAGALALFVWPRMVSRFWALFGVDRRVDRRA